MKPSRASLPSVSAAPAAPSVLWAPLAPQAPKTLGPSLCGALAAAALLAGCTASSDEVRPPRDQFFFPAGLVLDPDQTRLFVANANSDLRYDSGTLSVVNLAVVESYVADWLRTKAAPAGCSPDPEQRETLSCDEAAFIDGDGSVRIGNFATGLAMHPTSSGARLVVPVRGDPSVTYVDWDGTRLVCDDSGQPYSFCDDQHRLTSLRNDESLEPIREEPFGVYAESRGGQSFAVLTHLTSGDITLVDTRDDRPMIVDVAENVFIGTTLSLPSGTAIAGRPSSDGATLIYAVASSEDRVQMMTVQPAVGNVGPYLVPTNYFFLDAAGGNTGGSSDSRGLAFTRDGGRMLVTNRRPPSLQIYDTTLAPTGFPRNTPLAVYDICREASGLAVTDLNGAAPGGEVAVVACFREGTVNILDASGARAVEATVRVGRGPFDVVISTANGKPRAYVANFLEDSIGVIDLEPGSATQFREVLRIGETRK